MKKSPPLGEFIVYSLETTGDYGGHSTVGFAEWCTASRCCLASWTVGPWIELLDLLNCFPLDVHFMGWRGVQTSQTNTAFPALTTKFFEHLLNIEDDWNGSNTCLYGGQEWYILWQVVRSYSKIASSGIAIDSSKNMLLNAFWILWGYPCYQGPPPQTCFKTPERWIAVTHRLAIQKNIRHVCGWHHFQKFPI